MAHLSELPFHSLNNYELRNTIQVANNRLKEILAKGNLLNYIHRTTHSSIRENINCSYYYEDNLNNLMNKTDYNVSLLHLNIRSLDKHNTELMALINSTDKMFDIIALTEIGKKNIENRAGLYKDSYNLVYEMPDSNFGGAAFLIRKEINFKLRNDLTMNSPDYENIWVEINKDGKTIILGCIYRHPSSDIKAFTDALENNLTQIDKEKTRCIICGDLNIDALKIETHNNTTNFINTVMLYNYIPQIILPTRITENTVTLIDHIIVKTTIDTLADKKISGNIYSDITDHLPNFLLLKYEKPTKNNDCNDRTYVRIFGAKNNKKFKKAISEENWNYLYSANSPTEALQTFINKYNMHFEQCFPLKKVSRKRCKDKKWITKGLLKSITHKNLLFRKYIHTPNEINHDKYKKYRNLLTKCLRKAESNYYTNLINHNKKNLYALWKIFGPVVNPQKNKKTTTIESLMVDGIIKDDKTSIANGLNNHFANIATKMSENIPYTTEYKKYLGESITESIFLHPVNKIEVERTISQMNGNKAMGHDKIHARNLKDLKEIISPLICHIVNLAFKTGEYPQQLKLAKVIPIYKKSDPTNPNNYRPISLLSSINKITEKIIYSRLIDYLNRQNFFYSYQFGFRKNHSTEMALIEIIDNIRQSIDDNNFTLGLYIDLTKAFDLVNHQILLNKLYHYGIRGVANDLFKCYLTNRTQYVQVGETVSTTKTMTCGVPQGSVLGPLLFLIYVNDVYKSIKADIRLFADDTNIFIKERDPNLLKERAETEFNKLNKWFFDNKIVVNTEKTQYTVFARKNKPIPEILNSLKLNNMEVKKSKNIIYLGMRLDDQLKWNSHIQHLQTSLVKTIKSFQIIKNWLPKNEKIQLYYAYVHSKIKYGIQIYGCASKSLMNKIQVLQNKSIKILFGLDFLTPTKQILHDSKLLSVKDLHLITVAQFVHRQQLKLLPPIFDTYFMRNNQTIDRQTRQSTLLRVDRTRTAQAKNKIAIKGSNIWNILTHELNTDMTKLSPAGFVKMVKGHLIAKYNTQA